MEKSILITGCSSGIGLAAATSLKERGYRVFASARKVADVEKLSALNLEAVQLDVNDAISMRKALDQILAATGGTLDYLFNNSGFLQAGGVEDLSREMIRDQFETNVFGPMELIRLVLPIMRKQGHGRIVQNSSILGVITMPYYGAYNASKFALEAFSRTLQQELYGTNIYVSCINPGPITTKLRDNAFVKYQHSLQNQSGIVHEKTYKKLEETYFHPSKRDLNIAKGPEAVVKVLLKALESKKPKSHYFVGAPAKSLAYIQNVFPECVTSWVIRKIK